MLKPMIVLLTMILVGCDFVPTIKGKRILLNESESEQYNCKEVKNRYKKHKSKFAKIEQKLSELILLIDSANSNREIEKLYDLVEELHVLQNQLVEKIDPIDFKTDIPIKAVWQVDRNWIKNRISHRGEQVDLNKIKAEFRPHSILSGGYRSELIEQVVHLNGDSILYTQIYKTNKLSLCIGSERLVTLGDLVVEYKNQNSIIPLRLTVKD